MPSKTNSARRFARQPNVGSHIPSDGSITATAPSPASTAPPASDTAPEKRATKSSLVVGLLERAEGATLDELVTATGWLPHTARAAMTGLRKKGKVITRGKRGDVTCYFIADSAA